MPPVLEEKPATPKPKVVVWRAPAQLVEELDRAAAGRKLSRNEAMTQLLRFALAAEFGRKAKPNR